MVRLAATLFLLITIQTAGFGHAPKLAVVVSIDQYRGDYIEKFASSGVSNGFARIVREGSWFSNCYYDHANNITGPGHAAIMTGCYPYRSGITSNEFCDAEFQHCYYCAADSTGVVSPVQMQAPTIGELLRKKDGKCKVFALSIKDRAGVLMAGRNPNAVCWLDAEKMEFTTSNYYKKPDWFDDFKKHFSTERYSQTSWAPKTPASVIYRNFVTSGASVRWLFESSMDVIGREELGQDSHPDVMCIGLSTTDYVGHLNGPDSKEVKNLYRDVDSCISTLISYLDVVVGRKNYVLMITSDHGIAPVPEQLNQNRIPGRPAIDAGRFGLSKLLKGMDSVLSKKYGMPTDSTWVLGADEPSIFIAEKALEEKNVEREEVVNAAVAWFKSREGIGIVARRDRMILGDCPDNIDSNTCRQIRNSFHPTRSGDIMIYPKRYWVITGDLTSHGTPHDYDRWVPLLALGGPVPKLKSNKAVAPVDIAATLARWWKLKMPKVDGKALNLRK